MPGDYDHDTGIHFPDHHGETGAELEEDAGEPLTWRLDNVELVTIGVDIGSSTSHLLFSRLYLQRLAQSLSSRFVVVRRETLHRSPILLTPFAGGDLVDVEALERFVQRSYAEAGLRRAQVDTGAVILTGVVLQRCNARAVAELFAAEGGRFVCASAGHNLEAILAAQGSGAVAASRARPEQVCFHVDIGGGTSKLSRIRDGEILETAVIGVGGRLVVLDEAGVVERVEASGALLASELGVELARGQLLAAEDRQRLAEGLATALLGLIRGKPSPIGRRLLLTEPLGEPAAAGSRLTCSGGVAEYIYGRETANFGDISQELAAAFRRAAAAAGIEIAELPGQDAIRATAIGASQFSVQLSGNTVHISNPAGLPMHNLPVVRPRLPPGDPDPTTLAAAIGDSLRRLDLVEGESPLAVALDWTGEPRHRHLRALAEGVVGALPATLARRLPLVIAVTQDVGRSLGAILAEELDVRSDLVCIDGVELMELDYIDVGAPVQPADVVPVVIKSLAFATPAGIRHEQAHRPVAEAPG